MGRKPLFNEKTIVVSIRLPESAIKKKPSGIDIADWLRSMILDQKIETNGSITAEQRDAIMQFYNLFMELVPSGAIDDKLNDSLMNSAKALKELVDNG